MIEIGAMAYADALRGYITRLREKQGVSQRALAEAMGVARNTYLLWETGDTKDLKTPLVVRALRFLGVPLDQLEQLVGAETEEEGQQLADSWIESTKEGRTKLARIEDKFRRVIELSDEEPERVRQVIERLRADARSDPAILDIVMAYLDGRRSRPTPSG